MTPDLEATAQELIEAARTARKNSYSPYSSFPVGAAVRVADGRIFLGTNMENASYGLTCCAERVALFSARTATREKVTAIAIAIGPEGDVLPAVSLSPCGACRQVMAEFMAPDAPVYVDGRRSFTVAELLPHGFKLT